MFESIVKFFKTRVTPINIQPKIEVDYHSYDEDIEIILKKEWESLRKEINQEPSIIKKQEWNSGYSDAKRREKLTVEIDGVLLQLEGPYYHDPDYKKPEPQRAKSEEEHGNERVDEMIGNHSFIWGLTHCSQFKFNTLIAYLEATRASRPKDC